MQLFKLWVKSIFSKRINKILFLGFVTLVLFLLFLSFNPHDPSWMYYSTESRYITNFFGSIGAHMAAFFFYFFASASWLIVIFFAAIIYGFYYNYSFKNNVQKIVAFFLLFVSSCVLMYLYQVEIYQDVAPGGYFGRASYNYVASFFDDFGAQVFYYHIFFVSLVLLFPSLFSKCLRGVGAGFLFVSDKQKCLYPAKDLGKKVIYYISIPFVWSVQFVYKLFSGHDFLESKQTIIEFENQLENNFDEQDDFWQSYIYASHLKKSKITSNSVIENNLQEYVYLEKEVQQKTSNIQVKSSSSKRFVKECSLKNNFEDKIIYTLPPKNLFSIVPSSYAQENMEELQSRAKILEEKLKRFGVQGKVTSIKCGPVVTLFEYEPHIDSKISKIISLEDDLALALQALSIRTIAPIPGTAFVGFEVANFTRKDVLLSSLVQSDDFKNFSGQLPLVLGEDIIGNSVIIDLAKMPHLLIAGSTGSGKSVALNTFLISLLCKLTPNELKLILIDPKRLEFTTYADIAHLLFPIITDPRRAAPVLKWVVQQMEERYDKMADVGVRNIIDYNNFVSNDEKLPSIVVIIDELSDLMMTTGKEVEDLIARIAQMARAAGIHMIIATQRPSVDVITGLIKVNFPSRVSFRVTSKVDSRTILDRVGAEKLLGRGDMLFLNSNGSMMQRLHGAYVSDKEIENVVTHIKKEQVVQYLDIHKELMRNESEHNGQEDVLYKDVLDFLDTISEVSISLLQRKFRIGYNRSARIIDKLESQGLIMPADGGKKRKVVR